MKLVLYSCLESCYYTTFFDILYYYSDLFFFKQKTAYEMRISDWSSDVCSSDLLGGLDLLPWSDAARSLRMRAAFAGVEALSDAALMETLDERSAERRVGKECVSTGRSRWSPDHYKKNTISQSLCEGY